MTRTELRSEVFTRAMGVCEWPQCVVNAKELAHIHSVGMGGRKSADTADNCFAACSDHARISDGEYGAGGKTQYRDAHLLLIGPGFLEIPADRIGYERAEALKTLIGET